MTRSQSPPGPRPDPSGGGEAEIGWLQLRFTHGPYRNTELEFEVGAEPLSMGADESCTLCMSMDSTVDGLHALLRYDGGRWRIERRSASRGLRIDGELVDHALLRDRQQVTMGDSSFWVRLGRAPRERVPDGAEPRPDVGGPVRPRTSSGLGPGPPPEPSREDATLIVGPRRERRSRRPTAAPSGAPGEAEVDASGGGRRSLWRRLLRLLSREGGAGEGDGSDRS
jgi:hypothetical protein